MPGPTRVSKENLGRPIQPRGNHLVEFRFINQQGVTEAWMLPASALSFDNLAASVTLAYLDRGVDIRLSHQKAAIERLLEHVQFHETQMGRQHDSISPFGSAYKCDFQEKADAPPAG